MPQPQLDPTALRRFVVPRWVARAETAGLRAGTWVLLLGSFLLPGRASTAAGALALVLLVVERIWAAAVARRARAALGSDPGRLAAASEALGRLPLRRRTMAALREAVGGDVPGATAGPAATGAGPADGLTCLERGAHAPGCPHQQHR